MASFHLGDSMKLLILTMASVVSLGACIGDDSTPGLSQNGADTQADGLADGSDDVDDADDGGVLGEEGCLSDDDCDDAEADFGACEVAVCQTSTGECLVARAVDLSECDDADECTTQSFCRDGLCEAFPSDTLTCDDGDPCTADTCNSSGACVSNIIPSCDGPVCGDGFCDASEANTCATDCPVSGVTCGDGVCAGDEASTCPADCGGGGGGPGAGCGDGTCDQATLEQL
ncbi:MAG: hypothetical protein ACI9MR_003999, partial [Myxococcota bacterium]